MLYISGPQPPGHEPLGKRPHRKNKPFFNHFIDYHGLAIFYYACDQHWQPLVHGKIILYNTGAWRKKAEATALDINTYINIMQYAPCLIQVLFFLINCGPFQTSF